MITNEEAANKKQNILIVEDSPTQALKLRHVLEMSGFIVEYANNSEQALEFLKNNKPNIIISDIMMPGMDGYAFCKLIRSKEQWHDIPIILLTSLSEPSYVIHGLECGANGFVTKPYQEGYLLARVYDVLENRNAKVSDNESVKFYFSGKEYQVSADRIQILEVLISTYSTVLQKNDELIKTQNVLQELNDSLERIVEKRTSELKEEVEERKMAEQYLEAQYELSQILTESISLEKSGEKIFALLNKNCECDMFCIWQAMHHGTFLQNTAIWTASSVHASEFIEYTQQSTFKSNTEVLVTNWKTGKMEYIQLFDSNTEDKRANMAYQTGFRSWLIIPIIMADRAVGVMEFFWLNVQPLTEKKLQLLKAFTIQLSEFMERIHLQQQFSQVQKMESIGQLTGGIAHDFNNLLMGIQGNLELLLMQLEPEGEILEYIQTALSAVQQGAKFNQQLLAFSRKQMLQPNVIDVKNNILNLIKLLIPMLGESIHISTLLPDDLYKIYVDPSLFENALVNLAVNARDAMDGSGKLTIEAKNLNIDDMTVANNYDIVPGDYVKISITDTGTGIPKDLVDRVFEPFFTTKETGKGTGLGLSMVYGFIKQSKGYVTIYSELKQGTTINLFLPKAPACEFIDEKKPELPDVLTGTEKILLVEDDDNLRKVIVDYLGKLGYEIIQAANVDSALEILKKEDDIDLLFTDIVTSSELMGTQLAEQALKLYPNLKIIFTSGYPRNALKNKLDVGDSIHNFLDKPYKIQNLAIKIRQLLDSSS